MEPQIDADLRRLGRCLKRYVISNGQHVRGTLDLDSLNIDQIAGQSCVRFPAVRTAGYDCTKPTQGGFGI